MVELTFIVPLVLFFVVIFFLDVIFRSCWFFPYLQFLDVTGITVKPFAILWETTKFNRTFYRWSRYRPTFLRVWFQIGTYVSILCMIPAMYVVAHSFWISFVKLPSQPSSVQPNPVDYDESFDDSQIVIDNNKSSSGNAPMIVPIIPGLTLPLSQIFFYLFTLFVCMVIHEMGHAIASSRENLPIDSCGVGLYGIFPMAYVKLPSERLSHLLPWQQLRIFCAGIWHNMVLSLFVLFLMWTSPLFLSLVYQSGNGVSVVSVKAGSGIAGPSGLAAKDHIFSINDCEVRDINSWQECLKKLQMNPHQGFCSSTNFIKTEDITKKNAASCCPDSSEHLCFQRIAFKKHFCLPGRNLAEQAKVCNFDTDCGEEENICLVPVLENSERLLKIERHKKSSVLYVGSIQELKSTVILSGWTARFRALSVLYVDAYETILIYIVTFSSGLAIMNLIPCYGFDGAFLNEIIVHCYLSNIITQFEHRSIIIKLSNLVGLFMSLYAVIYGTVKYIT